MAHIIVTNSSREHLIFRAKERFGKEANETSQHIDRIKSVLEKESPEDWRFTRSPVAKFLICDTRTDFRLLGRTYRNVGVELVKRLKSSELDDQELKKIAHEYLCAVKDPNAEIVHEIKTIYKAGQDISELKHAYRMARKDLPHIVPINAKRVAARPNAIIDENNELWVRQEEKVSVEDKSCEYLFFERLTCKGIDKSFVRVYIHRDRDKLIHERSMDFKRECLPYFTSSGSGIVPSGFRTATYWSLPIYLDAYYMDLDHKREIAPLKLTGEEALLLFRIEMINAMVRKELGLLT